MSARSMAAVAVSAVLFAACGGGGSGPSVPPPVTQPSATPTTPPATPPATQLIQRISSDTFGVPPGQHASEVEPSAIAVGNTIVAAFQVGRIIMAGGVAIGFATSHDGGTTWASGTLPGLTKAAGGPVDAASDAVVAYDAAHKTWLIATLPIVGQTDPAPYVSRSSDGITWSAPVLIAGGEFLEDKEWIACDNSAQSPFYGRCYVEWDDAAANGLIHMSTTIDAGQTWGPVRNTADNAGGIAGQPLVLSNGTVVVPIDDFNEARVLSFVSHDGGASWSQTVTVANIVDHFQAGNLRSGPLVSTSLDGAGTVYTFWQDCRFRVSCTSDDLIYSTSRDGVSWSSPLRVPIDPVTSTVDHFIPGVAIDPASGGSAHIGITYYFYPASKCGNICNLYAGFISSNDGGTTWSTPSQLAGPMLTTWLPQTTEGVMVADYVATVFVGGKPLAIFANAVAPPNPLFDEAIYASIPGTITPTAALRRATNERPIPGVKSDHPPRRPLPPLF